MNGWRPVGAWRAGAAAAGLVAVVLLGIRLTGWPAPAASRSPSAVSSDVFEIVPIEPDVPVVVDADDAAMLAEAWVSASSEVSRVEGPINLPARAGPHWLVTLVDGTRLVVGVLLGDVAQLDVAQAVLQPPPISLARLTIEEARELGFASVGDPVTSGDSNASMDLSFIPGRAFWCGNIGAPQRRLSGCVDLVERRVYSQAEADALSAATEDFRNAFFSATEAFERATAAYRLVRALGPTDRLLGYPATPQMDFDARAAAAGLETMAGVNGVAALGPWRDVLAVLADLPATEIVLEEDRAALRPVPARAGAGPHPGVAYLRWPAESSIEVAGNIEMQPEQVADAMHRIAQSLLPAEGRPYDRLSALTLCATPRTCVVTVWGKLMGAGEDRYDFQLNLDDGIQLVRFDYGAVPRPMVQEAERIARLDPATAALLGTYETIAFATWNPIIPGRLEINYERTPPPPVSALDAPFAATSRVVDRLIVVVDVIGQRVESTVEELANPPTAWAGANGTSG